MKRKWLIGTAIAALVAVGFLREFVFIHMNAQLFALWYDEPSEATDALPLLKSLGYFQLYWAKWILTVFFSAVFYASIVGILHLTFHRSYWKELAVIYGVLFAGAALSLGIGKLTGDLDESYIIARFLMGIAQSPLLLMVMLLGGMLHKRQATDQSKN